MKILIVSIILILITLIIVILNINFGTNSSLSDDNSIISDPTKQLITVHLIFRHGARTAGGSYPTDPYINETYYPFGNGQLTKSGRKQMYEIGKWLRRRYDQFLGDTYDFETIYVQSTNFYRTKMSTGAVLAGLFPPRNTLLEWNNELNWQPIPIYATKEDDDHLLWIYSKCNRFFESWNEVLTSPITQSDFNESQQLFSELTKLTQLEFKSPFDILILISILQSQFEFGLKLPEWTREYYPDRMTPIGERAFMYIVWTDELKRLKGGPFIDNLIKIWKSKIENTLQPSISSKRNFFMYGVHDTTVVAIMSALNVWEQQLPPYGIMAIFEMHKDRLTGEYGVKIYQKIPDDNIQPLTIPGCEHFCPLDRFINLTKHMIPENMDVECVPKDPNFKPPVIPEIL